MYIILMNNDKALITTKRATINQRENLIDKIWFLIPQYYEDIDLGECQAVLKYFDQKNEFHSEYLTKAPELYKERLKYIFTVKSELTVFPGDVAVHISFLKIDSDTGELFEVLHTGEAVITVNPVKSYEPSIEFVDKICAMESAIISLSKSQVNELKLDTESGELSLTANGEKVGESISLNDLGDALADYTDAGLVQVITDGEVSDENSDTTISYSLYVDQETDELCLAVNGVVVSKTPTSAIGESIVDSTEEGLNEVVL